MFEQDQIVNSEDETNVKDEEVIKTDVIESEEGGLLGKKPEGISIEDIIGSNDDTESKDDTESEKVPGTPHGIQKKIDKEVSRRKLAEAQTAKAYAKLAELEALKEVPKTRPLVPLREDFDTAREYQDEYAKYEEDNVAYLRSREHVSNQSKITEQHLKQNIQKFVSGAERMRGKFPDFDELVTTGENKFGHLDNMILESDYSPEIAYFLRKNTQILEDMKMLSREKALIAIGELSANFKTEQKKRTNAPKSLSIVSGSDSTESKNINKIKDSNVWFRERNKQILRERNGPK